MARRRIGRETPALPGSGQARGGSTPDGLATLIEQAPVEARLRNVHAAAEDEPAWPPLALLRALLIAAWHDLSDVRLAEALDDRASSRPSCGFAAHEPVPERASFVRFREALLARGFDTALFDEVTGQLRAKAVRVKTGTLVGATVSPSRAKAHVGAEADTALVETVAVTPGNVDDGRALLRAIDGPIQRVRGRIATIFGTCKRS